MVQNRIADAGQRRAKRGGPALSFRFFPEAGKFTAGVDNCSTFLIFRRISATRSSSTTFITQDDKLVLLDRLVFETIFMSVKTLPNQPPTKFRELSWELLSLPSGTTTVGEELDRIKAAGCDERLLLLYMFWIASSRNVSWKRRLIKPDVKTLRHAAKSVRRLSQVAVFRPENVDSPFLTTPKLHDAADRIEAYAELIEAVHSVLVKFSRKNSLRDQAVLIVGSHIQEKTRQPIPWELITLLVNHFGTGEESADNLRKTYNRAPGRLADKTHN